MRHNSEINKLSFMQVWALDRDCPSLPTRTAQTEWSEGQTEKHFLMQLKNHCSGGRGLGIWQREALSRINSSLEQGVTKSLKSNPGIGNSEFSPICSYRLFLCDMSVLLLNLQQ